MPDLPPALAAFRCCRIEFYEQHGLRDWGSKFGPPTAAELLAQALDEVERLQAAASQDAAPTGDAPAA